MMVHPTQAFGALRRKHRSASQVMPSGMSWTAMELAIFGLPRFRAAATVHR